LAERVRGTLTTKITGFVVDLPSLRLYTVVCHGFTLARVPEGSVFNPGGKRRRNPAENLVPREAKCRGSMTTLVGFRSSPFPLTIHGHVSRVYPCACVRNFGFKPALAAEKNLTGVPGFSGGKIPPKTWYPVRRSAGVR
jgi:hypothetical protein